MNSAYDPMRKQGAVVLGNGGDNSNSSQGTFYEGAMTAAGTFPTGATDQLVQSNIVAAKYRALPLALAPASETAAPPGLQTFSPGNSQDVTLTFTNTTGARVVGVELSISGPNEEWTSVVLGTAKKSMTFANPVAPGASVSATFKVTSGPAVFNGDLVGNLWWKSPTSSRKQFVTVAEKVRNVRPIKINEFRIRSGPPTNSTDSFIELFNSGARSVDISNWTLTEHPAQQAIFSAAEIPAGTELAAGGFYLLGLSNSGLASAARKGDTIIDVRNTTGMKVGDTISISTGANVETRKIASIGTAASNNTTLWQPLPDGPIIVIPAGSSNVPVTSMAGFLVGQKIALGYGATYPTVPGVLERYEVATVTAVGKPGTQAYLAANAPVGATNIKVTSVKDISVGDRIRLDIDSVGHGIETVTVRNVGTLASSTRLVAEADVGTTNIKVRSIQGFTVGDKMAIGTPANQKIITITSVGTSGLTGTGVDFTPPLAQAYPVREEVVDQGTGLDLEAPLRFNHAANLPFSDRGTGISFQPATAFAHLSNEPVQALGTGITLDRPLVENHEINSVVRDATVRTAGYQGTPSPDQWFGGPALSPQAGSMVLRDAAGQVVDSLNYGELVDPWAAAGYQAAPGLGQSGCYVTTPGAADEFGQFAQDAAASNTSAGRFPDGLNTDSNCTDFLTSPSTTLSAVSVPGATNIKVASVEGFGPGQTIRIGRGTNLETAVIAKVGTAGATTVRTATAVGATVIPVGSVQGFRVGQTISIGRKTDHETAVVASTIRSLGARITVAAPLTFAHTLGAKVSGTGINLTGPLTREHASGAQVTGSLSTPEAPNKYYRSPH